MEYKVNFLAPAFGEKLIARGEVVTAGRRLFVCRAEVVVVDGREERVCAAVLQTVSLSPVATPNPQSPSACRRGYNFVDTLVSMRWKGNERS